jgi:hypothetical protein
VFRTSALAEALEHYYHPSKTKVTRDMAASAADEEEVEDLDELNEALPANFSINAYGADYPVDGLVKRIGQGDIVVPRFNTDPVDGQSTVGFQREFVWRKPQADRFVESLLLGLPVPGIFLVKELNAKLLVLDGQQRLNTMASFYGGVFQGKEFVLDKVQERWRGRTYKSLEADDRRRLDDSIIHATIVRQEEPSEDQSSIYLIFERLNSGGTFLQPQEIRVALYHGEIVELLGHLNDNADWRLLYGRKSPRLKDVELILRFFALFYYSASYRRPMKEFLNRYMSANRACSKQSAEQLMTLFTRTVSTIATGIGPRAFRPRSALNAAVLDAVMVGVATRLETAVGIDKVELQGCYQALISLTDFKSATERSTADEESVRQRLKLAREAFAQ